MALIETWIFLATLGFSLAAPLGPINLQIIKNILNRNYRHAISWSLGEITGIGAMTGDFLIAFTALTIGGQLLQTWFANAALKTILFSFNTIILGYLAIISLRTKPESIQDRIDQTVQKNTSTGLNETTVLKLLLVQYATGLVLVLTSPWSYLWWASFGSIILFGNYNTLNVVTRISLVLMFLSGIFLWTMLFSISLSLVGRLPTPRLFQLIIKGSALILLLFAIVIFYDAISSAENWFGIAIL